MRIVLDTNVFIAALITRGTPPDRIYQLWRRGHVQVVTSSSQIEELGRVLARPRLQAYLDREEAALVLDNLDTWAIVFDELPAIDLSPDPSDNPILATAIAGRAQLIISGDKKHMLALSDAQGIPIVTPATGLDRIAVT